MYFASVHMLGCLSDRGVPLRHRTIDRTFKPPAEFPYWHSRPELIAPPGRVAAVRIHGNSCRMRPTVYAREFRPLGILWAPGLCVRVEGNGSQMLWLLTPPPSFITLRVSSPHCLWTRACKLSAWCRLRQGSVGFVVLFHLTLVERKIKKENLVQKC